MSEEKPKSNRIVTPITCLSGLIIAILLFFAILFYFGSRGHSHNVPEDKKAQLTVIPAPTITPTSLIIDVEPTMEVRYVSPEGFTIGAYVRINGTQGAGLKVRPEAGTSGIPLFIAMDGDMFMLVDGPDDVSGYVWWKLQDMEDDTRTGWAAADYFELAAPAYDQEN